MNKGSRTFKAAGPLLLGQLRAPGRGDPLRPSGRLQAGEAGGSINGDENCPCSVPMSLILKENTVSKLGKGKR